MDAWMPHAIEGGRLLWGMIPASNPSVPAVIVADLGLGNGTPQVLASVGDETRRMTYLPPHAIQERPVVATRMSPAIDSPWIVEITNYQVDPFVPPVAASAWGSTPGAGAASATPSTDWAAGMADPDNDDGATLPMPLGEGAQ